MTDLMARAEREYCNEAGGMVMMMKKSESLSQNAEKIKIVDSITSRMRGEAT
jgi:hypothetical protein